MHDDRQLRTSSTLLGRLRQNPHDESAWAEFVGRYGPAIQAWCRRRQLQEADVQDVTQDVLLRLSKKMCVFAYDRTRSFRGWLRTITEHALSDFAADRRGESGGLGGVRALLDDPVARQELVSGLETQFDQEILEEAMAWVRLRVEPHSWEAFRLTAVEGLRGDAAALQIGLPLTAVYKAKSRILRMLREAVAKLECDQ